MDSISAQEGLQDPGQAGRNKGVLSPGHRRVVAARVEANRAHRHLAQPRVGSINTQEGLQGLEVVADSKVAPNPGRRWVAIVSKAISRTGAQTRAGIMRLPTDLGWERTRVL